MIEMATRQIVPACIKYAGEVAEATLNLKKIKAACGSAEKLCKELSSKINAINESADVLFFKTAYLNRIDNSLSKAEWCRDEIIPAMQSLRSACDSIEPIVDSKNWPMPNYTELLHRI